MRNPSEINVDQAIVHLVRRANTGSGPVYSEAELDVTEHERIPSFLGKHIRNSLTHNAAKTAKFDRGKKDAVVYENASKILRDGNPIVGPSTVMAKFLQSAIDDEPRAAECALACCRYRVENEPKVQFLALLKLEPAGAFRAKPGKNKARQAIVVLEELDDVLPSEREQLQKAALIRTPRVKAPARGEYDMMVLDRQRSGGQDPAGYFMKFLGAELALDPVAATWLFPNTVYAAMKELGATLSADDREQVFSAVRVGLSWKRVEPVTIIENLDLKNGEAQQAIAERVRDAIPDYAFAPDPSVVAKLYRRRRFEAENDIRLSIDTEASKDQSIFSARTEGEFTIVTIKARGWHEVLK
jgi:hypothetical protein